jgi:membrane protease YdiL (CAAX protease family)
MKRKTAKLYFLYYALYLIFVWFIYRALFLFPEAIEEIVVKPIVWIIPLVFILRKEKKGLTSLGFNGKNIFKSIYFVLAFGVGFALLGIIVNYLKYGGVLKFDALVGKSFLWVFVLTFVTAFIEETVFRGYFFTRLMEKIKNEWGANILSSLFWVLIHLPLLIFSLNLDAAQSVIYLVLIFVFGFGSALVFSKSGNLFASIVLHVLWQWPIILFR